jgi:hypothetical protein
VQCTSTAVHNCALHSRSDSGHLFQQSATSGVHSSVVQQISASRQCSNHTTKAPAQAHITSHFHCRSAVPNTHAHTPSYSLYRHFMFSTYLPVMIHSTKVLQNRSAVYTTPHHDCRTAGMCSSSCYCTFSSLPTHTLQAIMSWLWHALYMRPPPVAHGLCAIHQQTTLDHLKLYQLLWGNTKILLAKACPGDVHHMV